MSITINHIGIAVKSLDDAIKIYFKVLGVNPTEVIRSPGMDMGIALYTLGNIKIEVMEPVKKDSPISRFIESRGEGVHHICFEVENIDEKLKSLTGDGIRLIDTKARRGIEGMIAFIHPKETTGVLMELLQKES